ncbi:ATP synthase F1 subunit gamma [Candidatus Microgenomates bacterium]|nr:MAG: ATP synthase F1 subunit gamma [Candidatus Microgenomates bacterium]
MANILSLKRRIQAAQNVSKTTRAMQMIAASKLKKAQEEALSIRPYVEKLSQLNINVSTKIDKDFTHPYLKPKVIVNKTLLIALSPDKGLCGGLITNLIREFLHFHEKEKNTTYVTVGKKIESQVSKLKNEVIASFKFGTTLPTFDMVYPISRIIDEYYLGEKVDSVKILSTQFSSFFTQKPIITQILPIVLPPQEASDKKAESLYIFEPDAKEILPSLLKHYLEMTIFHQLLESYLSEQASRMITMQNATNNAKDIIEDLRLEYNKTRQAKITNEILDIGSGTNVSYKE